MNFCLKCGSKNTSGWKKHPGLGSLVPSSSLAKSIHFVCECLDCYNIMRRRTLSSTSNTSKGNLPREFFNIKRAETALLKRHSDDKVIAIPSRMMISTLQLKETLHD